MKTPFVTTLVTVLRKDLLAELRSRELISAMVLFALLSVFIFSFALELNRLVRREVVGGVLWVTLIFAIILGLNRSSVVEREGGSFDATLLAPIDRTAIYVAKLLSNFLFTAIVGLLILPIMTVLYNLPLVQLPLILTLLLGILGLATVGTLLSAMTVQTRTRETLLPIVMLPVALPLILAAVNATSGIMSGDEPAQWVGWIQLMGAIDVIYFALCFLLFEAVIED